MLIKLLPEQLVKFWDMLRFAIAETFVPRSTCTNEHLKNILVNLLSGKSQCWLMKNKDNEFVGFLITRIAIEDSIKERVLSLDHIYAYKQMPEELWETGYRTLEDYARNNSCKAFVSMTENARVVQQAEKFGFTKRFYLSKEV